MLFLFSLPLYLPVFLPPGLALSQLLIFSAFVISDVLNLNQKLKR